MVISSYSLGKCKLGDCEPQLKKLLMKTTRLRQLIIPESGFDLATVLSVNHKKLQVISVEHNRLKDSQIRMLDTTVVDEFNLRALTEVNISNTCLPIENFLALLLAKDGNFGVIARNNNLYCSFSFVYFFLNLDSSVNLLVVQWVRFILARWPAASFRSRSWI